MKRLIHRMNQTAHISLQFYSIFKERRDKSDWMRPNFLARPASITSDYLFASRCRVARLAPRRAPQHRR